MDSIEPLPPSNGCESILVIVDRLSKMGIFIPTIPTLTAKGLARICIEQVFSKHGTPRDIVSDRGSKFTSDFWRSFNKALNIEQSLSTAFHPETDGQTERSNSILETYLRSYVSYDQEDWAEHLPLAEFAYNNATHASTGVTSFFANKAFHHPLEITITATTRQTSVEVSKLAKLHDHVRQEMAKAQLQYQKYADARRLPAPNYKLGDQVFLEMQNISTTQTSRKLGPKRTGPYTIEKVINKNAVRFKLPESFGPTHPTINVSKLEPAPKEYISGRKQPAPAPVQVDGHEQWEVSKVLESRCILAKLHYRFLWLGFEDDDTEQRAWQPAENAAGAEEALREFHEAHPNAPGPEHTQPRPSKSHREAPRGSQQPSQISTSSRRDSQRS